MAAFRTKLAAATWTDLTALYARQAVVIRSDLPDLTIAAKATAPTAGTALAAGDSALVLLDGTVKLYAHSTAGGMVELDQGGPTKVIGVVTDGDLSA